MKLVVRRIIISTARMAMMAIMYPLSLKVSGERTPRTRHTIIKKAKMTVKETRKASLSLECFNTSIKTKDKMMTPLVRHTLNVE
jgi:hypothetical protein